MRHHWQLHASTSGKLGAALLLAAASLAGCVVETSECDDWNDDPCPTCSSCTGGSGGSGGSGEAPRIVRATIDADETLQAEPGEGIGVFIEYASGGRWHVFATCDTKLSELSCDFNVIARVPSGTSYSNVLDETLEAGDRVHESEHGLELVTTTSSDFDGMYFDTPQGTTVQFEVLVDGQSDPHFVYWVGGGALHSGAPSNPIELKPSE